MNLNTEQTVNIEHALPKEIMEKGGTNAQTNLTPQNNENLTAEEIAKKVEIDMKKINFEDELSVIVKQNTSENPFANYDFAQIFHFDTVSISGEDAQFFLDLIEYNKKNEQKDTAITGASAPVVFQAQNIETSAEVQASNKIINMLETCITTKKPVRIDFDNNITLVLRVDTEGKISAHFYPNDKAAEEYLKNNIMSLKQTFDEENILYSYLGYGKQKRDNQKEERQEK